MSRTVRSIWRREGRFLARLHGARDSNLVSLSRRRPFKAAWLSALGKHTLLANRDAEVSEGRADLERCASTISLVH